MESATPRAELGPDDELERQRRRHPAERHTSRWSGILLLLVIPHAAFGYALVGLAVGVDWVRTAHFMIAPLLVVIAALLLRSVLALPWRRSRERALIALAGLAVLLLGFQLVSGLWMRWSLPGTGQLWIIHVGGGILNALLVALLHTTAILPSILLSAKKEHARLTQERRP